MAINKSLQHAITVAISLFFILFSPFSISATASVSNTSLSKEEVFQLKVVTNENLEAEDVDFSVLEKDFFIGQPRFGFYTNITNGKKSVRSEWTLALAPLRAGILTIPSFQVGNSTTQAIKVTVSVDPQAKTEEDLIEVKTNLIKKEWYIGELNTLETRIIIKADSRQIQNANIVPPIVQSANIADLQLEPIGDRKEYQAVLEGMDVIVVDQNYKLTASEPGEFIISGPALKGAIVDTNRRSGTSRIIPINTTPDKLTVSVMGQPEGYQGNWLPSSGLNITQKWLDETGKEISQTEALSLTVGSPITRQIIVRAEGVSSEQLPNLRVSYPKEVRVYQDAPQLNQEGNTATLTISQVIIAKRAGEVELPDVSLAWWNTLLKQAERSTVPGLIITAEAGETSLNQPASVQPQRPIETATITETVTVKDAGVWPYVSGILAIVSIVLALLLIREKRVNKGHPQSTEPLTSNKEISAILHAVKERDAFKANALFNQWQQNEINLSKQKLSELKQEFTAMQESLFNNNPTDWNDSKLISLLKNADKRKDRKDESEALASL